MKRVATIALLFACACATAPDAPVPEDAGVDVAFARAHTAWRIRERMQATGATAVSVAFVDETGIVWADGFGAGPLAGAVDGDTIYGVGSLSKLVTCLLTLQLDADGALDVDAPLAQALPELSVRLRFANAALPTPRSVMTHHSGLPSDVLWGMYGVRSDFTKYVELLRDEPVATPPWTVFSYSNAAYSLLGHAVQRAAGAPFAAHAKARLFAPLGMTRTSFDREGDIAAQRIAPFMNGAPFAEHPPVTTPANGLFATAADLGRLALTLLHDGESPKDAAGGTGARVLDAEHAREVFRVQNAHVALDAGWREGLGLNIGPALAPHSGPLVQHSGQTISFAAELMMLPEQKLAVVVLTNTNEALFLPGSVAREALGLLYEAKTGEPVPPAAPPREARSFSNEELASFAGDYATDYGLITLGAPGDGTLSGRAFEETLQLVPTADRSFVPYVLGLGFLRVQPELLADLTLTVEPVAGHQALVSTRYGMRMLRGVRVAPLPIDPAWRARVGRWTNTDPGDDHITITGAEIALAPRDDGELLLLKVTMSRMPRPLVMVLDGRDPSFALTRGYGRSLGETLRIVRDARGGERLMVSGYPLVRAP